MNRYQEVLERENTAVAPESLAVHRRALRAQSALLQAELDRAAGSFSRTLAGFLALASEAARKNDVKLKEIVPVRKAGDGEDGEVRFKVSCRGEYHQIARVVNALENSPLDVHITKVELSLGEKLADGLVAQIEGRFKTEGNANLPSSPD